MTGWILGLMFIKENDKLNNRNELVMVGFENWRQYDNCTLATEEKPHLIKK